MEFIEQQVNAGYDIHLHEGIWWARVAPFFCKPAFHLEEVEPGQARPKRFKSVLGYSHIAPDGAKANRNWPVLMLDGSSLRAYSIRTVSSSKRSQVRKGLGLNEIRPLEDIGPYIYDLQRICISTAKRTRHGRKPEYYVEKFEAWRSWLLREFSLSGRLWYGAFHEGRLAAYLYSVPIEDSVFIYAAKSDSDYLDKCPNDALIYSFVEICSRTEPCGKVIFGDWSASAPTLNEYKMKFGFEKTDLPVYASYNPVANAIRRFR